MQKKILITTIFICGIGIFSANSQNITNRKVLKNTGLKQGYAYGLFTANEQYIVWFEYYTSEISVYNLKKHRLNTYKVKKGRGPHEYLAITDIGLTNENKIILNDPNNDKWIVFDIGSNKFKRDIILNQFSSFKIVAVHNKILSLDLRNFQSLYHISSAEGRNVDVIDMNKYPVNKEFIYIFKREGFVVANKDYGINLSIYYPNVYVINMKKKEVIKKIQIDKVKNKKGKNRSVNGKNAQFPPQNVDVLSKDIAFVPNMDHSIVILAKGRGKKRSYKLGQLRVFDFIKEKFTSSLDLGLIATEITTNDNYLFVYSKDKNEIYQYKVVHSK